MSASLFLIAHKVRGEPAFDVAIRMDCPECSNKVGRAADACIECDGIGYWWIIPTSGHRAYPWQAWTFEQANINIATSSMPSSLPDHYPTRAATEPSLIEKLGIGKAKPTPRPTNPIARRF